ncbi:MAG: deoxyribodipyrimidine photo-lyase [Xanthomonadales bacterium]|nr:deoxyribodipyrimidine photo-lyase [Xanthomonadales bacterium]
MPHDLPTRTALIWFRRDLRLDDHPALDAALRAGYAIVPVYVHAPGEEAPWAPGAASRWWLHHALLALDASLRRLGSGLVVRAGASLETLLSIARECGASAVYWHRRYEPAVVARDTLIKRELRAAGLHAESLNGALLAEPWQIATGQGDPYRVFTPYWRRLLASLDTVTAVSPPPSLPTPMRMPAGDEVAALGLLPRIAWDGGLAQAWTPGEAGAQARLRAFLSDAAADYAHGRDRPDRDGTSRLSAHLHFGEISPRRALLEARARGADCEGAAAFIRELGWREFSHHLLHHFPETPQAPLNPRYEAFPWREDAGDLVAWQRGRTGIPLVDAGMRQLWRTGWMHNRVRMVVASLLTKNLRIHWLAGARWFWDTLVDADLANNTQGWQWTAGSGADAAPYFRVFNPAAQGERFDPDGCYVRHWLPELARLPSRWLHRPWQAPVAVLDAAGVDDDSVYRRPIVDLQRSREDALAAWRTI